MFERLNQIESRYDELTRALASPEVINDSSKYQKTAKAHSELSEIVEKYREYKDLQRGIDESKAMIAEESDAELKQYAQEEVARLEQRLAATEADLKILLVPKDPNDEKHVALEIRAGTGGHEATLFAAEMIRMHSCYAATQRCVSPTCRPIRSSAARTRSRRSKIARRACVCCARASTRWRWKNSSRPWPRSARRWSVRATVARRFAPTTFRRTA